MEIDEPDKQREIVSEGERHTVLKWPLNGQEDCRKTCLPVVTVKPWSLKQSLPKLDNLF